MDENFETVRSTPEPSASPKNKTEEGVPPPATKELNDRYPVVIEKAEDIDDRINGQITQEMRNLSVEDLEERRKDLALRPQLSSRTLTDTLVGVNQSPSYLWVGTDKVVGRTWEKPDSWASEIDNRKGRIVEVAKDIIESDGSPMVMEHVFHHDKPSERIKLVGINGPVGPMYFAEDGTHRVAASMAAGLSEIPCSVKSIAYPVETIAMNDEQVEDWQKKINLGLIEGRIEDVLSERGIPMKKLIVNSEVLPWIRTTSQTDMIKISKAYLKLYPEGLDNLSIPKEALIDYTANDYFMARKWEEWKTKTQPST